MNISKLYFAILTLSFALNIMGCSVKGNVSFTGSKPSDDNPTVTPPPSEDTPNGETVDTTKGNILVDGSTVTTASGHKVSIVVGELEVLSVSSGYSAEPIIAH